MEIIPGFFHFTYILNPGAAFGLLTGQRWFFVLITFLVLGGIFFFGSKQLPKTKVSKICQGMIAGGALGNLYDRLFIGKVVDFLDFKVWSYIFNIADSVVVVGGILLAILIYQMEVTQNKQFKDGK